MARIVSATQAITFTFTFTSIHIQRCEYTALGSDILPMSVPTDRSVHRVITHRGVVGVDLALGAVALADHRVAVLIDVEIDCKPVDH
jgi:hypothetical protein